MKIRPLIALLSPVILLLSAAGAVFAQTEGRIIRADRRKSDDVIEIVSIKLGETPIRINEMFVADENWLKQLKITVKNVGSQDISCLIIAPGLLDGMDDKLGPHESWGWKLPFILGSCDKPDGNAFFKTGTEIELSFANVGLTVRDHAPLGKFHKAVLEWASVIYANGEEDDVLLRLPPDTRYLEDKSY